MYQVLVQCQNKWQLKLQCIMNCNSQSAVKVSLPVAFCISAMRVQAQYNPDLYYTQCKLQAVTEGCREKNPKNCLLLPNPPRTPPPRFGLFSEKKIDP